MNNFTQTISLGYICNVYAYLLQSDPTRKNTIFDNIATPMWAIYNLIDTNFASFMLPQNMQQMQIFENNTKQYWVDNFNYIRFLFYNPATTRIKLQPLIDNFFNTLSNANTNNTPLLFIRYQEPMNSPNSTDGPRIVYPQFTQQYSTSELSYLQSLSDLFKQRYPNLVFKILYMNFDSNFVDDDHNIVGVQTDSLDYQDRNISTKMVIAIQQHTAFINTNLVHKLPINPVVTPST